jgi:SAM-dependent methyltransferase
MAEHSTRRASAWIERFAPLVPEGGTVLDLAAGKGRHSRFFAARGHAIVAVDRDVTGLADLAGDAGIEVIEHDLETGAGWPLGARRFGGVVVTNYLWRPILGDLLGAVAPGGVLIYETFGVGNEHFGKPSNPDFLLRPGELLDVVAGRLAVVAYEHGEVTEPWPAVVQRICAVNAEAPVRLPD